MTIFKIALLQIDPTGSMEGNLEKGLDYCRQAKNSGADLALFPEAWQAGYAPELMNTEFAIDNTHSFITEHVNLAKELQMAIAVTYIKRDDNGPKNNLLLIDQYGNIILEYAKVHICDFKPDGLEDALFASGLSNPSDFQLKSYIQLLLFQSQRQLTSYQNFFYEFAHEGCRLAKGK